MPSPNTRPPPRPTHCPTRARRLCIAALLALAFCPVACNPCQHLPSARRGIAAARITLRSAQAALVAFRAAHEGELDDPDTQEDLRRLERHLWMASEALTIAEQTVADLERLCREEAATAPIPEDPPPSPAPETEVE